MKIAAVVGVPHAKWEERPLLIIEAHDGVELTSATVIAWLCERTVKWWLPDRILFEPVPLTATGKIDKKAIRAKHQTILLEQV